MSLQQRLDAIDWQQVSASMHEKGYALVPGLLGSEECQALVQQYPEPAPYRKSIIMERYRFGLGEYKYFAYPLPELIQQIRSGVYPQLAGIANTWMQALQMDTRFPEQHEALLDECRAKGQDKATVLILKYGAGGHNTLHQDLYGDTWFPIQLVLFLSEPGRDYRGGEFVLTQQVPRAQSKAIVLQPRQGDMLLFTTNFRPVRGSKSYFRANMKHGVSEVQEGERYTLGIIFHDALS